MDRKRRIYPKWNKIKDRKMDGVINKCSIARFSFFIAKNNSQTSRIYVVPAKGYESYSFDFDEESYREAIEMYERIINDYLDGVEQEFYKESKQ